MKEDEKQFLKDLYNNRNAEYTDSTGLVWKVSARYLINQPNFYMNYKRAWYILGKWCGKGWYEYGTTLDLGWLTDVGVNKALEVINS